MLKALPAIAAMVIALSAPSGANTFSLGPASVESAPTTELPHTTSIPPIQLGAILVTKTVPTANGKLLAYLPCYGCVLPPNSGYKTPVANTFGTGEPLAVVFSTIVTAYVVTTYTDISYTGSCNFHILIVAGSKTIINANQTIPGFKAGHYGFVKQPYARGEIPFEGQVTISTQLTCGKFKSNTASTEVFVE
jgi:hypothetical protein